MVPLDIDNNNITEDSTITGPTVRKLKFERASLAEVLFLTSLLLLVFYIMIYCLIFLTGSLTNFDLEEPIEPTWGQSDRRETVFWHSVV